MGKHKMRMPFPARHAVFPQLASKGKSRGSKATGIAKSGFPAAGQPSC
jgi:hypothetical protein